MAKKTLTYKAAYEELEGIVSKIEDEEPNVDELSDLVKRATELLAFCKGRLRQTEAEVQATLEDLAKDTE